MINSTNNGTVRVWIYDTDAFLWANVVTTGGPAQPEISGALYSRASELPAPEESDQIKAHKRAIAVLGPKRGRWK